MNLILNFSVQSYILCKGTMVKMVAIPMRPANPISFQSKHATIIANNGAIQIEFIFKSIYSKRLTSFDSRFTTLPGDVSPSAHCDKRSA